MIRKFTYATVVALSLASLVSAETLEGLSQRIDDIRLGRNVGDQIQDLRVKDDVTAGGDLALTGTATVGGNLALTGTATVGGNLALTGTATVGGLQMPVQSSVNVTNGQAVTLSAGVNLLFSRNGANNATNTITLVAPMTVGNVYYVVNTGTSNALLLAESGTWVSDALAIAVDTGYTVVAVATNEFRKF
jgi:hypothetical protein